MTEIQDRATAAQMLAQEHAITFNAILQMTSILTAVVSAFFVAPLGWAVTTFTVSEIDAYGSIGAKGWAFFATIMGLFLILCILIGLMLRNPCSSLGLLHHEYREAASKSDEELAKHIVANSDLAEKLKNAAVSCFLLAIAVTFMPASIYIASLFGTWAVLFFAAACAIILFRPLKNIVHLKSIIH